MAVDPPYRLDPLQNPVDVKWEEDGDGGGEPGNEDCWGLFPQLLIVPDNFPVLHWDTPDGAKFSPGDAAGAFGFSIWYLGEDNVVVCYDFEWLAGEDCGFAPGPTDQPPTSPPADWEGFNHSPNSEE